MSEPTSATAKPLLFGRYRVEDQLGTGRLATVYHATDERLQRRVLMHVLRKDLQEQTALKQRFLAEVSASAQCSHPALLEVYDSGESGGRPYMVTEYVQGRPLNAVGALRVEDALLAMRQVAGAVALCLARGQPHPPISSSNVLLVGEGQVRLVENWHLEPADVALDLSHYRAPELTEGDTPATPASVVYTLGILLYELVSGVRPITGSDAQSVAQAHLTTHIPPLSQVRPTLYLPTLERILSRATSRLPEQRPANARAFGDELEALWRSLATETKPLAVAQPARAAPRRASAAPPRPAASPAPAAPGPTSAPQKSAAPVDREVLKRKTLMRSLAGWFVMMALLIGVVLGSYSIASFALDQFFAVKLPQPTLPDFAQSWAEWFPGVHQGEVLIVNINEGLNLRDEPGLSTNIIAIIRNGARVRKLEESQVVDNVEWVRVRAETADIAPSNAPIGSADAARGNTIEGWMSLLYLKPSEQ